VIQFFFLYMTLYPEIQAKAQAEIDTIIGHDRLPTVSDREHLPYVQALLLEVYRYGIVLPQALPHTLTSGDDRYDGYFIPKGSIVIPHVW
jgi:cytochrome P450